MFNNADAIAQSTFNYHVERAREPTMLNDAASRRYKLLLATDPHVMRKAFARYSRLEPCQMLKLKDTHFEILGKGHRRSRFIIFKTTSCDHHQHEIKFNTISMKFHRGIGKH